MKYWKIYNWNEQYLNFQRVPFIPKAFSLFVQIGPMISCLYIQWKVSITFKVTASGWHFFTKETNSSNAYFGIFLRAVVSSVMNSWNAILYRSFSMFWNFRMSFICLYNAFKVFRGSNCKKGEIRIWSVKLHGYACEIRVRIAWPRVTFQIFSYNFKSF